MAFWNFSITYFGGARKVGRHGNPAGVLLWGSERGGRNFAAPAGVFENRHQSRGIGVYVSQNGVAHGMNIISQSTSHLQLSAIGYQLLADC